MLERLQNCWPLAISAIFHLALISVIVFSFTEPSSKKAEVGVSIMSNQLFSKICQKQQRVIKDKKKHRHKIVAKSKSNNIKKDVEEDDSRKEQGKKIRDISYTKDVYKIGSKQNPAPPYPRIAKLRNYQGLVEICIISDNDGKVVNAEIHKSSGYSSLDRSALRTIKGWKLAIKNSTQEEGREQLYRLIVPISFVINN